MNVDAGVVFESTMKCLAVVVVQLISSLLNPSLQSSSPSHFQDRNIHFLLAH